jgi:hypothetical protein
MGRTAPGDHFAGIGVETVRVLVEWGAHVIMGCRNTVKAQGIIDDIERRTGRKGAMENWEVCRALSA